MRSLKGLGVAMVTPFDKKKNVDFEALDKLTNHLIDNGVDYLVVQGTTGESVTLSNSEKKDVLDRILNVNNGRLPIVLGMGGNNTMALIETIKTTDFADIDAILSVAPYYNKPTQEGMFQHFTAIADASPVPVILYNVPGRTSSNILPSTVLRLAKHKNIVAIKEASGSFDQFMEIIMNKPEGFLAISGDDGITQPFIAVGGDGVISVVGNAYPRIFSDMVHAALKDEMDRSRELHYKILPIIPLLFKEGNPAGVKEVLKKMGICDHYVRLPLVTVSEGLKKDLLAEAAKL
jgi:4-hydroxy-tetrahydrodipicolinate synthase